MTWLLVGGAGYIGGHVTHRLRAENRDVVVFDDLSTGVAARVPDDVPLIVASATVRRAVANALREYDIKGVIFLAGRKSAPDSVAHPLGYYRANVEPLRVLLEEMGKANVTSILLSSSAAVYGVPDDTLVTEDSLTRPINPYGETKLVCEWLLRAVGTACGLNWISLRYFNVVGAAHPVLADRTGTSLLPMVIQQALAGQPVQVTGSDYPTPDGTGIRDYVHAADVADAHAAAIRHLEREPCADIFNVGTGRGHSVMDVLDEVRLVTGMPVRTTIASRRPSDPAKVVASVEKIRRRLDWRARHGLSDMVRSAWQAHAHQVPVEGMRRS